MPNRRRNETHRETPVEGKMDVTTPFSGALLAVLLHMLGMLGHKPSACPRAGGMLFLAVLLKLVNGVSPRLQEGSQMVYKFFARRLPIRFCLPSVGDHPVAGAGQRVYRKPICW